MIARPPKMDCQNETFEPVDPLDARITWRLDEYGEAAAVFDRPRRWPRVIARALALAGILLACVWAWFLLIGFLAELP